MTPRKLLRKEEGERAFLPSKNEECHFYLFLYLAFTIWTFVGKVLSLFFNTLSRFVIDKPLLPRRSFYLNFMTAVIIWSDFQAQENKVHHCFHCLPIYVPWSDGTRCDDLSFFNKLKSAFPLFSLIFIKRLFSSSVLSAIRLVSSGYLRLLIYFSQKSWFQFVLHLAWHFTLWTLNIS